jgi:putative membrane protein
MVTRLSESDHARVSSAIAAAEGTSAGEILAVVTDTSDRYHDVALHWSLLVLIAVLAWAAAWPASLEYWWDRLVGGWHTQPSLRQLLTFLMILAVAKFTAVLLILRYMPLRLWLTPGNTKTRRVRRRALTVFKAAAERRTAGRTGILIYLSMGEHRAEIIGDEAITSVTTAETWGEAMTALLGHVREGRVADGMVAAIERIGVVLSEHFPRSGEDKNEIPDKLIEL